MKLLNLSILAFSAIMIVGCGGGSSSSGDGHANSMKFYSNDVSDGGTFDKDLTPDGTNESPHLKWTNTKGSSAKGYAVIIDDISTSPETVHWNLFTDDPTITELSRDYSAIINSPSVLQATNYTGGQGYEGPQPPQGETHNYKICVYLLGNIPDATNVNANSSYTNSRFSTLFNGDILDSSCFIGKYTGI